MGSKTATRVGQAALSLAERQHGVVSLAQLEALGVSERRARSWVERGRLQRIHRGVFALGDRVLRPEGHWMAAVLACGPAAVLSHFSAAALRDLRATAAALIDVTAPGRRGRSRRGIRIHSARALCADECGIVAGIPCTSVARTLLDLAGALDGRELERVCERAAHIEELDVYDLNRLLLRHARRRGVARLRCILEAWDPDLARTRSELEALFLRTLIEAGLKRPLVNRTVETPGGAFEVDFQWPGARLIVETDGARYHDNPLARARDASRDRLLAAAGWTVRRLDWSDVTGRDRRAIRVVSGYLAAG
jgi:very-short-patch-repair endonuclease